MRIQLSGRPPASSTALAGRLASRYAPVLREIAAICGESQARSGNIFDVEKHAETGKCVAACAFAHFETAADVDYLQQLSTVLLPINIQSSELKC